jgi:chromosome partitioning protein
LIFAFVARKGGVAKSTSAIHLAGVLSEKAPTLRLDGDSNRSCIAYSKRSAEGLPFPVVDERQATKFAGQYTHVVIDSEANPTPAALEAIAGGCDRLVLVTSPDAFAMAALMPAVEDLRQIGAEFKILLTIVPPTGYAGGEARDSVRDAKLPLCKTQIRRYAAFQRVALDGLLVRDVSDPYAAECWADYVALTRELLK